MSVAARPDPPAWTPIVCEALTPAGIETLLARAVPYIHVPRFLDPAWCDEIVRRFNAALDLLPDHRSLVMGPAVVDALARPVEMFVDAADKQAYFTYVVEDAPRVRALFQGGEDPLEKMRSVWRAAGWHEVPAVEDVDRLYHPDAVWGLRKAAAPPHIDAYERDRPVALSRFERHINYNVYLQRPDAGGGFAVYQRFAPPATGPGRFEPVLDPAELAGTPRIEHTPAPGDLVVFDATLYHEVTPVDGTRRARIQEHSNILVDPQRREFLLFA
jgi:carrier-protein-independent halogenase WelO5-like protein